MDMPSDGSWIARLKRSWAALGTFGQVLSTISVTLAALVSILNSIDSLSSRRNQTQPASTAEPARKSRDINTGAIDEQRAKEAARLREAQAEARCLAEREKAKEASLLLMNSTRRAHDLCLTNFLPTLKELVTGITARDKCAPHMDAFQDAEKQYRQAVEQQCKKAR